MQVPQLLRPLLLGKYIEVVITRLPERRLRPPFPQSPRHQLLQHLDRCAEFLSLRFADQQMNVLRHDDVTEHRETIPAPHLFQGPLERSLRQLGIEQCQPPVTTEGEKVIGPEMLVTLETGRHP